MTDEECVASLSTPVWSYGTGGTIVDSGINSLQSELETGEKLAMVVEEEADTETVLLGQWLDHHIGVGDEVLGEGAGEGRLSCQLDDLPERLGGQRMAKC